MLSATLTSKGQTTIPKRVRDFLHLHPGDQIDFILEGEGKVIIRPATLDITHLKGILKRKKGKKLTIEQMNMAIEENTTKGK